MTAALYDVKAHLSEYITYAENGEVVEITKHGVATTVLISLKMFQELQSDYAQRNKPSFIDAVAKWRRETGGLSQDEADEYCNSLEQMRKDENNYKERENPWL